MKKNQLGIYLSLSALMLGLVGCGAGDRNQPGPEPISPDHQHNFSDWEVVQEVSDYKKGIKKRECQLCHKVEYSYQNALKHSWYNHMTDEDSLNLVTEDKFEPYNGYAIEDKVAELYSPVMETIEASDYTNFAPAYDNFMNYYKKICGIYSVASAYYRGTRDIQYATRLQDASQILAEADAAIYFIYCAAQNSRTDSIVRYIFGTADYIIVNEIVNRKKGAVESGANSAANAVYALANEAAEVGLYDDLAAQYLIAEAEAAQEAIDDATDNENKTPAELIAKYTYGRQYDYNSTTLNGLFNGIKSSLSEKCFRITPPSDLIEQFNIINNSSLATPYKDNYVFGELLDDYILYTDEKISDCEMKDIYMNLWTNGYYFFSDDPYSLGTAYQDGNPIDWSLVYFSSQYQSVDTVCHEFGHYYADRLGNPEECSYDLLETHSKGNEMCFANYLKTVYPNDPLISLYADYQFINMLFSMLACAYAAEIEFYVYDEVNKGTNVTVNDVLNKVDSVYRLYFPDGTVRKNYWYAAVLSPIYYFSYATSSFAAASFYLLELDDAIQKYQTFVADIEIESEVDKWTGVGLSSPFDSSKYTAFQDKLDELKEKYTA